MVKSRVWAAFGLCLLFSAPLHADDLVPRVLQVLWDGGGAGPNTDFVTQLLDATLAQDAPFLIAEEGDKPDSTLTLKPIGKNLSVEFHDRLDPTKDWTQTVPLTALTTKALRTALAAVIPRVQGGLPPVPPQVREVVTEKVVQDIQVQTKEKGITVSIRGVPGSRLVFAGGTASVIPAEGTLVLTDQVQFSSVVFDVSRPGFFSRHVDAELTDQDGEIDAKVVERPRWSMTAGVGGGEGWNVAASYRVTDGTLEVLANLVGSGWVHGSNVLDDLPNPLGLPLGPIPSVTWLQGEIGALWYGSAPEDFFQWGFQGLGTARIDLAADGSKLSSWLPFGLRAQALAELRFAPWLSFDVGIGSWLSYSTADLSLLDTGGHDPAGYAGPRISVEKLGYDYQEDVFDFVTLVPGLLYLRPFTTSFDFRVSF